MYGQKARADARALPKENDARRALLYRNQAYVQCTACVVECPYSIDVS